MNTVVTVHQLSPTDKGLIDQIAGWYFDEWKIPVERTINRLGYHPNDDILFQLVLKKDDRPIATGGLYNQVGLLMDHPKFRACKPWVALLYTEPESRNQGFGEQLLMQIEANVKQMGLSKIYLYTFTAESLYIRAGWTLTERVNYRGHDAAVMEKNL